MTAMRVGLVCPYSLSIPGGVQGQVLGLARSLRAVGHEVRVLGPCDGPPPDAGVTPLGRSVPTAANGVLYVASQKNLFAVKDKGELPRP